MKKEASRGLVGYLPFSERPKQEIGQWLLNETEHPIDAQALQPTIDQLREMGLNPVIIITDEVGGKETYDHMLSSLEEMGYGHTTSTDLDPSVVVCQVHFGLGDIDCVAGDFFILYIKPIDLLTAQQMINDGYNASDLTQGLKNAFEHILTKVKENEAKPTIAQNATRQTTTEPKPTEYATATPATATPATPTLAVVPKENQFQPAEYVDRYGTVLIGTSVILALLTAALVGERKWLRPRLELIKLINKLKEKTDHLARELSKLGGNNYFILASLNKDSYPDSLEGYKQSRTDYEAQLNLIVIALDQLIDETTSLFFKNTKHLESFKTGYQGIEAELEHLQDLQENLRAEIEDTESRIEKADGIVETAEARYQETLQWYAPLHSTNPLLPMAELATKPLAEINAEMNGAYAQGKKLAAADSGLKLSQTIESFREAVLLLRTSHSQKQAQEAVLLTQMTDWKDDAPSMEAITRSTDVAYNQAATDLSSGNYDGVSANVRLAETQLNFADEFIRSYNQGLIIIARNQAVVDRFTTKGFIVTTTVSNYLENTKAHLTVVTQAIASNNNWKYAQTNLVEAFASSTLAKNSFETWIKLQETNRNKLLLLSGEVATVQAQANTQTMPDWENLQKYPLSNYAGLENNYTQATQILSQLFDDPSNPADLASEAERYNSLATQQFDQAEAIIADMYSRLSKAKQLLDQLSTRNQEVEFAKSNIAQITTKAEQAISQAKASYAGGLDRLVAEATETGVDQARTKLEQAAQALDQGSYLLALKTTQEAINIAIQTKQSADTQVAQLQKALSQADRARDETQQQNREVLQQIQSTPSVIIQRDTQRLIDELNRMVNEVENEYLQLSQFEDSVLFIRVTEHNQRHIAIQELIARLVKSIEQDEAKYRRTRNEVVEAIESASSSIASARAAVDDPDSDDEGRSDLRQASSTLPQIPSVGTSYGQLEQIKEQAEQAKRYADAAKRKAKQAISDHEDKERRAQLASIAATTRNTSAVFSTPTYRSTSPSPSRTSPSPSTPPSRGGMMTAGKSTRIG